MMVRALYQTRKYINLSVNSYKCKFFWERNRGLSLEGQPPASGDGRSVDRPKRNRDEMDGRTKEWKHTGRPRIG